MKKNKLESFFDVDDKVTTESKPKRRDRGSIFYVYIYCDPRKEVNRKYGELEYKFKYEPIYVGKGMGDRWISHIYEADRLYLSRLKGNKLPKGYNTRKIGKIHHIYDECGEFPIIIKIKENITDKDAQKFEIFCIKQIGRIDKNIGPLTNFTDGGEGSAGSSPNLGSHRTQEQKLHQSIVMKGRFSGDKNPMFNYQYSPEQKENQSKRMLDLWKDEEYRNKQIASRKESYKDPEVKKKKSKASKNNWADEEYRNKQITSRKNSDKVKEGQLKNKKRYSIPQNNPNYANGKYRYFVFDENINDEYEILSIKEFCKDHNYSSKHIINCFINKNKFKDNFKFRRILRKK